MIFRKCVQSYTGVLPVVSVKASQKNVDSITASFFVKAGALLSFLLKTPEPDLFRFISLVHAAAHTNVLIGNNRITFLLELHILLLLKDY